MGVGEVHEYMAMESKDPLSSETPICSFILEGKCGVRTEAEHSRTNILTLT